ncbi:hypothetical protein KR52_05385 [Synechococcus sp. KORDI-52]|uniref:hypothetical protein n=1 Tax=Synechococcus sp. KORDI-52 TaxID=585425 RepID=UPI0004E03A44|nr:hypothetical protein [Synechococcus sp. KORDI-52]AII48576.1 hypothetical protein KR52_05385 [Synechococcus sp. KORDI-52]
MDVLNQSAEFLLQDDCHGWIDTSSNDKDSPSELRLLGLEQGHSQTLDKAELQLQPRYPDSTGERLAMI